MPTTPLPSNPSFENLKKQAKSLRRAMLEAKEREQAEAVALVSEFHPRARAALADFALSDAQLVIARRHGFPSWPKLKKHVEVVHEFSRSPHEEPAEPRTDLDGLTDDFLRNACLTYGGDHVSRRAHARKLLAEHPEIGAS